MKKTMTLFCNSAVFSFDYIYYVVSPDGAKVTQNFYFQDQANEARDRLSAKDGVVYQTVSKKAA